MRTILTIALLICIAALLGWVSFSDQGDTASINIDKQEAQQETEEAVEAVEETVEDVGEAIDRTFDGESPDDGEVDADARVDEESVDEHATP